MSSARMDRNLIPPRLENCPSNPPELNPEHPDRDDGTENGQTGDGPSGCIGAFIGFGPVHHVVTPFGHESFLATASCRLSRARRHKVQSGEPMRQGGIWFQGGKLRDSYPSPRNAWGGPRRAKLAREIIVSGNER